MESLSEHDPSSARQDEFVFEQGERGSGPQVKMRLEFSVYDHAQAHSFSFLWKGR